MLALRITCPWWTLNFIWPVLTRIQIEVLLYLFGIFLLVNLWAKFLNCDELFFLWGGLAVNWAAADVDLALVVVLCKAVSCVAGDCGHLLMSWYYSLVIRLYWCCCDGLWCFAHPELDWLAAVIMVSCYYYSRWSWCSLSTGFGLVYFDLYLFALLLL